MNRAQEWRDDDAYDFAPGQGRLKDWLSIPTLRHVLGKVTRGGRLHDPEIGRDRTSVGEALPRVVAIVSGIEFVALGVWAMADPHSFFEAVARFEPYNQHFLQDVGAFQVGLGVVLLLAGLSTAPMA